MAAATTITYLFDPLCGWCYGATAALEALTAQPEFDVRLTPSGLFSGTGARPMDQAFAAFAWSNDQRIARQTGQLFSEAYRNSVLTDHSRLFDSGPATVALTAVNMTEPAKEHVALKAIQEARYIKGLDITDLAVLSESLRSAGLQAASDRILNPDDALKAANRDRVDAARADMQSLGIQGVPALLVGDGPSRRAVAASALFGSVESLVEVLKAA